MPVSLTHIVHFFYYFTYCTLFTDSSYRTGYSRLLRADCWFQDNPESANVLSTSNFAGIRINIWNLATVPRFLTLSQAGGGSHNLGYGALNWEMILHGNAGKFGKYDVLSILLEKIVRFLYEYHGPFHSGVNQNCLPHRVSLRHCDCL